jgi:hypothetical protein
LKNFDGGYMGLAELYKLITISKSFYPVKYFNGGYLRLGEFDHINWTIALSVITLPAFTIVTVYFGKLTKRPSTDGPLN